VNLRNSTPVSDENEERRGLLTNEIQHYEGYLDVSSQKMRAHTVGRERRELLGVADIFQVSRTSRGLRAATFVLPKTGQRLKGLVNLRNSTPVSDENEERRGWARAAGAAGSRGHLSGFTYFAWTQGVVQAAWHIFNDSPKLRQATFVLPKTGQRLKGLVNLRNSTPVSDENEERRDPTEYARLYFKTPMPGSDLMN
jgi:hypothetical protein